VERGGLDQDALQIHGGEQLPQNRALVVLAGVISGLGNRRSERLGVEPHLGNEGPATAIGRDDGAPQGLAIAHQLIQTCCAIRDLGEHPRADSKSVTGVLAEAVSMG
jgi:hypothetical protein